ncbi:hypothetical protein H6G36_20030 [Anabaena minutissima FACHB-250]|nr:hypothetical protein [Anabaena minutissima FACHB-250]
MKNTKNKESKLSQLSPESKLLPAELATAVGGVALPRVIFVPSTKG